MCDGNHCQSLTEHFIAALSMFTEQMIQGKKLILFFFFLHKMNLRFYVDHILCCVPQVSKPNMTETQTTKQTSNESLWKIQATPRRVFFGFACSV
jgi:hypothetical protein